MARIFLVTCSQWPDGEPAGELLPRAIARCGHDAVWVRWDDPTVDWSAADLVAVRSAWDYHRRLPEFLHWARAVETGTRLLNGADVFGWNADKAYLVELGAWMGGAVVPTVVAARGDLRPALAELLGRHGRVVVKPRVGASGLGVLVVDDERDPRLAALGSTPSVLQPLVESVRTVGETSVHVFGGRAVAQLQKRPAGGGEFRVNEQYGGTTSAAPLGAEEAALAEAAVAAAAEGRGADLSYARVDLMEWADRRVVSELELIEPGLYLDVDPRVADRFAALVGAVAVANR